METISLPVPQSVNQTEPLVNHITKSAKVDNVEVKRNSTGGISGQLKVKKKKSRVEDIITNLTKKVSLLAGITSEENTTSLHKVSSAKGNTCTSFEEKSNKCSPKEEFNEVVKDKCNNSRKNNPSVCEEGNNKLRHDKKNPNIPFNVDEVEKQDVSSTLKNEGDNEETSSFVSMCRIREELPAIDDVQPSMAMKQSQKKDIVPTGVALSHKSNQITKNPVRQVILQTSPQNVNQKTPIILNKLPPGVIIKSDQSFTNLQTKSTSAQPKLLLITRAGGPFYLTQNLNMNSGSQLQLKPVKAASISCSNDTTAKVRTVNTNISNLNLSCTPKAKVDNPMITLKYNLPYPNNNCKVVSSPQSTRVNITGLDRVVTAQSTLNNIPREMTVNFAGNQTAHVTTMIEEASIIPENQVRLVPASLLFNSSPVSASKPKQKVNAKIGVGDTNVISNVTGTQKISAETSKASASKAGATKARKTSAHVSHKKPTYDEKIELLNSKTAKTLSDFPAHKTESSSITEFSNERNNVSKDVRMSNRKRQQTEKAKLLEKETKKRRKSEEKSPGSESKNLTATTAMTLNPSKQQVCLNDTNKRSKTTTQQTLNENADTNVEDREKTGADADSLFRDPALLTREERFLQRALMMFKELEEKQTRKESTNDSEKSTSESINQAKKANDSQRKRKFSVEDDQDDVCLKKRKEERRKQSAEKAPTHSASTKETQQTDGTEEKQGSDAAIAEKKAIKKENDSVVANRSPPEQSEGKIKKNVRKKVLLKKLETKCVPEESIISVNENNLTKVVKSFPKVVKPLPKTPESAGEKHRVKTYMLVPSYNGFKDFSPVVLGSRTRSKKIEPVNIEKEEDEVPVTCPPETNEKDIPLLVIETVGNKAVKQDIVAKDEEMRDLVKSSLRRQGMLKQELNEKSKDAEQFENREKRNLTVNRNTGETVLHKASRLGYDETVYHCIQQGSDSNAKDNAGWTPLHEACSRGHSDVVTVLVKYNADVNACSNDGIRPIHDAADNGNLNSLRLLLSYDADPFISTYSGRFLLDCAKRPETKEFLKACIGDLYLNDERNDVASLDYESRWDFRGSCSVMDKDNQCLEDVFNNEPQKQRNNIAEFEWSETPHLRTYNLPLVKDGIVLGRKNYLTLHDVQKVLNKPRQNVIRLLKRTKIREVSWTEFEKQVATSHFNKLSDDFSSEDKVELVPLNWTVRSLLKIKCEHLAL